MMEKEIIKIASPEQYIASQGLVNKKKRVAAYARVSTDFEDQIHSFKAQIDEYTKKITSNPNYEFVGMYSDEGISGTSLKHRDGLNALLKDAKAGKVDLIYVKSISRLGRNTLDVLTIIKELREKNVEIKFEKENISSLDTRCDMILTFHSSIAQEEAKNISDNVKWSIKKKMKEGNWSIPTSKFLGYTKDENGNMIIDEEQAKVVRAIFNLYLANKSMSEIIAYLEGNHYLTGSGKEKWHRQNIMLILQNEKYKCDLLLQKTVTLDYLSHERKDNRDGQYADMYLVKNHHPAIIERESFDLVQTIIKQHKLEDPYKRNLSSPLSGKIYCGICGKLMIFQSRPKERDTFVCNVNRRNIISSVCEQLPIRVEDINNIAIQAMKEHHSKEDLTATLAKTISALGTAAAKQEELNSVKLQILRAEETLKSIVEEKMESDDESKDEELSLKYKETKKELNQLKSKKESLETTTYQAFISENRIKEIQAHLAEMNNDECYLKLVDEIIIGKDGEVTIVDNCGSYVSEKEIMENIKNIQDFNEILHGFYSSPITGKVYKYKVVRLGGKA